MFIEKQKKIENDLENPAMPLVVEFVEVLSICVS